MTKPKPNNAVVEGVRAFYEQSLTVTAAEMPGFEGPDFDDLTSQQYRAWILAFSATAECAVRVGEALMSIGLDDQ